LSESAPRDPEDGEPSDPEGERLRNLALFVPRFVKLLGRLVVDPEVPAFEKILLGTAILYVVSPLDIIPDGIPILGQLDDLYLIALCLLRLMNRSGPARLRQHWQGPEDIVQLLQTVSDLATRSLPEPVRHRIRAWVEVKAPSARGRRRQ
jgi:uncharacterized membrane protein YkvA (DUF1232 family)